MPKLHAVLIGAAALACASAAVAAPPVWNKTTMALPDGSQAEIEYVGDIPPKVRVAMPVVQGAPAAVERPVGQEVAYGGIPRARRVIQPPAAAPLMRSPAPGVPAQPAPPQFIIAGDQPKGSTYEYTLITTGADGKVCTQRTEWTSRGKGKEPKIEQRDTGEGCATMNAPPPVSPAQLRVDPTDPNAI